MLEINSNANLHQNGSPFLSGLIILGLFTLTVGCSSDSTPTDPGEEPEPEEPITLQMVDDNATENTRALYSNLWAMQSEGVMFGHHDDLIYGRHWMAEQGRSDIKDITGDYPAVFSVDLAEIMNSKSAVDGYELNDDRRRTILEAYERGEVIIANAHLNNPLTGGDAWDNSSSEVVSELLTEGSETHQKFKKWLDNLAEFVNNLRGHNGELVPLIFRPFHEHNHSWSWWGSGTTTSQEYIDLWRFTINYLRDEKNVHNLIYAISPQLDGVGTKQEMLYAWPGDEYVDFIGMDSYHGTNTDALAHNVANLEELILEKKKPGGITETGIEGIRDYNGNPLNEYWTREIMTPLIGHEISMVIMWRNKYDPQNTGHHYFAPFEGHSSVPDFIEFYNSSIMLFSNDLPDMYEMAEGVSIQ
ncbi:glycoside hydrolase family 26 protein [Rhodohalobacter sp. 614A]|uniref:glycoside hydrolase family 26 protein n=1 Tax=Rhodohalobacter sp. 614A TaxID=2908649 RepID=UPI001F22E548|nr:glycosyl hydrolase [Rhodohalobacter sp. 614A]